MWFSIILATTWDKILMNELLMNQLRFTRSVSCFSSKRPFPRLAHAAAKQFKINEAKRV